MNFLVNLLLRLVLLAVGLVFFASVAVAVAVLWLAWSLRMGWARLTGRPVSPFIMGIDPRKGFEMYRRAQQREAEPSRTPRADATRAHAPQGHPLQVTDVEPREPGR
ncbi:hypothetical protein [Ramlibacter tataouinensis]|uniref:Uncharacterized protein n=1 Tax=Ramlibacter tataouinensis (strain ATCC BAA-407 / DSM 14655 / LMG 21543 / TTB310) TaxID=365046 RepID=F5Y186_RAMTT|nr:hypothetical protein [Ramlibacter tataouinensis]AEG93487.1 Hypothetical protein Rta_23890 [Ramlibacter tataouinensis TTB310]